MSYSEELGTIEGATAEEVQKQIRANFDSLHDPKKRVKILTFGERWNQSESEFYEGQTNGIEDRGNYWVTWKVGDRQRRAKLNRRDFFLDTPENRTLLKAIVDSRAEITRIEGVISNIEDEVEKIKND